MDPDAVHRDHDIPDVAPGFAALGAAPEEAYGRPSMLPEPRSAVVLGRIGGDEFVLLMPEVAPEQVREAAVRLRRELGAAMQC